MIDLSGYKLTFAEEFSTRSISQDGANTTWADIRPEWRFDANSDIGFGRSSFVDAASGYDPFKVADGVLTITAVPDRTEFGYPGSWESGVIHTKGEFSQTYGYFEMRADLSDTPGSWDAFWLLPDKPANNLPGWQELDIVEHYGNNAKGVYSWIHTTDPSANPNLDLQIYSEHAALTSGYHTYGMEWGAETIGFYVDGELMGTRDTPSDMHGPMYILANLAAQTEATSASSPMTMKIDYIRAYSSEADAGATVPDTVPSPGGGSAGLPSGPIAPVGPGNADLLMGTSGADTINAGYGSDTADGLAGSDAIYGNQDTDSLIGGDGNDVIYGGQDADVVYGNFDDDELYGNLGDDVLYGGQGNDVIFGGQGNDTVLGNLGNDTLNGDLGDDVLSGGGGSDLFVFASGGGRDIVIDFSLAENDRLDLSGRNYTLTPAADGSAELVLNDGDVIILEGMAQSEFSIAFLV
jgi:beta-glucanase (GH16 family)